MIEEPGSFSGSYNSPNPDLGPDPKNLMSLATYLIDYISKIIIIIIITLKRELATVFKAPWK